MKKKSLKKKDKMELTMLGAALVLVVGHTIYVQKKITKEYENLYSDYDLEEIRA